VSKQFTLGKNERLKSRKSIEQLFSVGKSFTLNPFKIFYLTVFLSGVSTEQAKPSSSIQFGVGVSTKNFKKAVDRNRIKRQIREAYRLQKSALQKKISKREMSMDIFIIYTGKELPEYTDVHHKIQLILDKLEKITEEKK